MKFKRAVEDLNYTGAMSLWIPVRGRDGKWSYIIVPMVILWVLMLIGFVLLFALFNVLAPLFAR